MRTENKPKVTLVGSDGNAFIVIGTATRAIKKFNRDCEESEKIDVKAFQKESMSGDYDKLIQTVMKYCEVS